MAARVSLTDELHTIIVTAIEAGCYRHEAANLAGIHPGTLRDWERRGEQDLSATIDPDSHTLTDLKTLARKAGVPVGGTKATLAERLTGTSPFAALAAALKNAHATRTVGWRDKLEEIARGGTVIRERTVVKPDGEEISTVEYSRPSWQAFAWLLERTRPDDYARRDRVEEDETKGAADPATVLAEGEGTIKRLRAVPDAD